MVNLDGLPAVKLVDEEGEELNKIEELYELTAPSSHYRGPQDSASPRCVFSPDGALFAWSYGNGYVKIVHFDKTVPQSTNWSLKIDCAKYVHALEFGSTRCAAIFNVDYLLATGLQNGRIKIWNPLTGDMVLNLSDHYHCIKSLSFASTGEPLLVSCSIDKTLKVWDLADEGNMTLTISGQPFAWADCAFSPVDHTMICSVGQRRCAIIWKLHHKRSYKLQHYLKGHQNDIVSCSFSPDGALVATASYDSTVMVWDPYVGHQILILGHCNPLPDPIFAGGSNGAWVRSVCFSPDGSRLATVCEDDKMRVWSLWTSGETLCTTLSTPGFGCRFSPCGSKIAVGKSNGSATILQHNVEVSPLSHLSRLAARRVFSSTTLENLKIPPTIRKYLQYRIHKF